MKFGQYLASSLIAGWEAHYFDYWRLKEYIKQHTTATPPPSNGNGGSPTKSDESMAVLTGKFDHDAFIAMFRLEDDRVCHFVCGKLTEIVDRIQFLEKRFLDDRASEISAEIIKYEQFVLHSITAEEKILKKYSKWTGQASSWHKIQNGQLWRAKQVIHSLVVYLSTQYEKQLSMDTTWAPPDTFVRKTVKYWVRPEHATACKLFIIKHLPILEVTKSEPPPRTLLVAPQSQIHNYLSSVYFDSEDAACYHRRIRLEEGANLLRIRWYGGKEGPDTLPRPQGPETVFYVELKTHHDAANSGLKSTKERFPITGSMLTGYLTGKLTADQVIDVMVAQKHIKADKAPTAKELSTFIQGLILTLGLQPMIRTVYHRTAFQRSDSNEVRISFDLPLYLLKEHENPSGEWMNQFNGSHQANPFNYGVLEVKTAENPPPWVSELLETGWLVKVEKFSKFQHAMATYHPSKVSIQPYWMNSRVENGEVVSSLLPPPPGHTSATAPRSGGEQRLPRPGSSARVAESTDVDPSPRNVGSLNDDHLDTPLLATGGGYSPPRLNGTASLTSRANADKPKEVEKPKTKPAAPPQRQVTNLTRMKVDPKVFFANERTFLHWMFAAVLLVSISMSVLAISTRTQVYGVILLAIACLFIIYAVVLYRWRLSRILRRDGTRFDDRVGPWVIGTCVLGAAILVFVTTWVLGQETEFVCELKKPKQCPPIHGLPKSIQSAKLKGTSQFASIADALNRAKTCGSDSTEIKRVLWEATSVHYCYANVSCDDLHVRYLYPELTLDVFVRNVSGPAETVMRNIQNPNLLCTSQMGPIYTALEGTCQNYNVFTAVTISNVTAGPAGVDDINAIFGCSVFPPGAMEIHNHTFLTKYHYGGPSLAGSPSTILIEAEFADADDQSLQANPIRVDATVVLDDPPWSSSTLRRAQALIEALFEPPKSVQKFQDDWHKKEKGD